MNYLKFAFLLLILAFSTSSAFAEIESKAKYAYLLDYNTGTVLFEKNANDPMHPASMTKLMTGYLIFDALKTGDVTLDTEFLVSEKAWRKGGSKMFVKEGDDVKVRDLLQGIIVQSGNDACIVIAEGFSGSETAFAQDMNFMAKKMGLENTNFKNSTGWPDDEHVTTAKDLVILAQNLIDDFPEYYPYYSQREFTYQGIKQYNRNRLLSASIGADGLKTGYTKKSGYGIVSSAEQDGRRLILAINGLSDSKQRIAEAKRLLRHGFRDFKNIKLFKAGEQIEQAEVWLGKEDFVPLVSKKDVEFTKNKRVSQQTDLEMSVTYNTPWPAPVKEGTHIANLVIKQNDSIHKEIPLYAGKTIEEASFFGKFFTKIKYFFFG